jgi:hypothetical protein
MKPSPFLCIPSVAEFRINSFGSTTTLHEAVALSFVIPSVAEGSAVPRTFLEKFVVCPDYAGGI